MYKTAIITSIFLTIQLTLPAQDTIPIAQWIDARLQMLGLRGDTLSQVESFRASWIRELEFRTETEDFEPGKQEYLFRFSPSTPRIRRAQARLVELAGEELAFDRTDFRAEVMKYLLEELAEIRSIVTQTELKRRLLAVFEDEQKLISNLLADKSYNLKDLLQVETTIEELNLDISSNEDLVQLLINNKLLPATSSMIPIAKIAALLESIDWTEWKGPDFRRNQWAATRTEAEMELEKAEKNRIIDFVQFRYNGPHTDVLGERLAIGLGFDLPFSAAKKLKLEELRVEQLIAQQELRQEATMDSLQVLEELRRIGVQIKKWQLLNGQLEKQRNRLDTLLKRGMDPGYETPEILLFQQEVTIRTQLDILKLEDDIYRRYFNLLEAAGILWNEGAWQSVLDFVVGS